jgi:uracil-DNA glycosylase family 4
LCKLCESRTKAVPGDGRTIGARLMIVGEAPGRSEDQVGRPFGGAAGKLLDSLLRNAGLRRENIYITNIVKCRPPGNRKPEKDEIETCTSNYLKRQIDLVKPRLVCTLGGTALQYFTGGNALLKEAHGKLVRSTVVDRWVYPTYHPASVFRNRSLKEILEGDVERIPGLLRKLESSSDGDDDDYNNHNKGPQ